MAGEQDETVQVSMAGGAGGIVGTVLASRYRVDSKLGQGGMATVYLATDQRVDRQVVVKVPHERLLGTPGFLERFRRELRSLIQAEHPNVVQLYDMGEHEGVPFAVAQYLRGGNLGDRIARTGPQTPEAVGSWLPAAAQALDSIHTSGFAHRDIKPDNVLFDQHGNVFVSDFGIAKALPDPEQAQQTQLTQAGYFVGSAAYAPPEALDEQLSPAYDQYSLAVTVYQALSGELPYQAGSLQALLRDKATHDPTPLPRRARLPRRAERALMRAMAREPEKRFPSCRAFSEAFAEGLSEERPRWKWALAAGLVLAVGAGALWTTWDGSPASDTAVGPATALPTAAPSGPGRVPDIAIAKEVALPMPAAAVVGGSLGSAEPSPGAGDPAWPGSAEAIPPALARVNLGSSEAEIRAALALCAEHEPECRPEWYASETLRSASIPALAVDPREVTNAEFAAFANGSGYVTTAEERGFSYDGSFRIGGLSWRMPEGPDSSHEERPQYPVVHVSARDAIVYCTAQGKRLPTEDEWEFTARGEERRIFPWGDDWDAARAVWHANPQQGIAPVGSRPAGATPQGHLDLAGNVWEWTLSEVGEGLVLKGGSWRESNPANLRSAARMVDDPEASNSDIGFRCVAELGAGPSG